jgi:hypothetical protein
VHSEADVARTLEACEDALKTLPRRKPARASDRGSDKRGSSPARLLAGHRGRPLLEQRRSSSPGSPPPTPGPPCSGARCSARPFSSWRWSSPGANV